jgi:hypothetical protein
MLIRLAIVAVPLITSFLWAQFILRFFLDKEYRMGGDYVIAAYGGFVFTIATFILPRWDFGLLDVALSIGSLPAILDCRQTICPFSNEANSDLEASLGGRFLRF